MQICPKCSLFIQTGHRFGAIESGKSGDGIDSEEGNVSLFGIYKCFFSFLITHTRSTLNVE